MGNRGRRASARRDASLRARLAVTAAVAVAGAALVVGSAALALTSDGAPALPASVPVAVVLVLAALLAICAALIVRRSTRPLEQLGRLASSVSSGTPSSLVIDSAAVEVRAVTDALVSLDAALVASEARQREFLLGVARQLRVLAPEAALAGIRVDRVADDLVELADLETGEFGARRRPTDVDAVIDDAVVTWTERGARVQVAVTRIGASCGGAETDARLLRRVVDGLLENALRATPPGGRATIAVERQGHGIVLVVDDDGPEVLRGEIAPTLEGTLHADRQRATQTVGTGFGLAVAARTAERMGGALTIGGAPGRGGRFAVVLPAQPVTAHAQASWTSEPALGA